MISVFSSSQNVLLFLVSVGVVSSVVIGMLVVLRLVFSALILFRWVFFFGCRRIVFVLVMNVGLKMYMVLGF